MMGTMTLTEFLRARLDEDEATARAASPAPWQYGDVASVAGGMLYDQTRTIASVIYEQRSDHDGSIVRHLLSDEADANGAHIARHDPARVLAEVEAKRRIVDLHHDASTLRGVWGAEDPACSGNEEGLHVAYSKECAHLRILAAVYADHPDYSPEWSP